MQSEKTEPRGPKLPRWDAAGRGRNRASMRHRSPCGDVRIQCRHAGFLPIETGQNFDWLPHRKKLEFLFTDSIKSVQFCWPWIFGPISPPWRISKKGIGYELTLFCMKVPFFGIKRDVCSFCKCYKSVDYHQDILLRMCVLIRVHSSVSGKEAKRERIMNVESRKKKTF